MKEGSKRKMVGDGKEERAFLGFQATSAIILRKGGSVIVDTAVIVSTVVQKFPAVSTNPVYLLLLRGVPTITSSGSWQSLRCGG